MVFDVSDARSVYFKKLNELPLYNQCPLNLQLWTKLNTSRRKSLKGLKGKFILFETGGISKILMQLTVLKTVRLFLILKQFSNVSLHRVP